MESANDERIIELFFARSEQAIIELSRAYGAVFHQIASNILKNDSDAEECVNDAYLAAWNTIPPQRPNPLPAYLCRIVRNLAIAKYHANTAVKRNSFYDIALDELEPCFASIQTIESELIYQELTQKIDRFLDSLSVENRVMFIRRYWYADDISEIAKRLSVSKNNVSVRLFRIRNKLKKYLKKEGILS